MSSPERPNDGAPQQSDLPPVLGEDPQPEFPVLVPNVTGLETRLADRTIRETGLRTHFSYDAIPPAPPKSTDTAKPFSVPAIPAYAVQTPQGVMPRAIAPISLISESDVNDLPTQIVRQTPAAGSTVAFGSTVEVVWKEKPQPKAPAPLWPLVAGGLLGLAAVILIVFALMAEKPSDMPAPVTVPSVVSMTVPDATTKLQQASLVVGTVTNVPGTAPLGTIVAQTPGDGTITSPGTSVNLDVSTGKNTVPVPDVGGSTAAAASSTLGASGLALGTVTQVNSDLPVGTIVGQAPAAGVEVLGGTRVNLSASNGKRQVPTVLGKSKSDASAILSNAGFAVKVETVVTDAAKAGTVTAQSPDPGNFLDAGQTVIITVAEAPPKPSPSGSTLPPFNPTPTPKPATPTASTTTSEPPTVSPTP